MVLWPGLSAVGRGQHGGVVQLRRRRRGRRTNLHLGPGAGNVDGDGADHRGLRQLQHQPDAVLEAGERDGVAVDVGLPGGGRVAVDGVPGRTRVVGFAVGGEDGGFGGFDDAAGWRGTDGRRRRRRRARRVEAELVFVEAAADVAEDLAHHRRHDQQGHHDDGDAGADTDEQVAASAREGSASCPAGARRDRPADGGSSIGPSTSVRSATAVACCNRFKSVDALRIPPSS